jgi:hypothetical protein
MMPPRVRTPRLSLLLQGDVKSGELLRNRYRVASGCGGSVRVSDYFPRGSCRTCACGAPNHPNGRRHGSRFVDEKALGLGLRVPDASGERFDSHGAGSGGFRRGAYIRDVQWCVGAPSPRRNKMSGAAAAVGAENPQQPQRLRRLKSFTTTTRNWIFNRRDIGSETESNNLGLGLNSKRSFSSASKMGFHGMCCGFCCCVPRRIGVGWGQMSGHVITWRDLG